MANTYRDIISNLSKKKYNPIYFLMGAETYYIDKISDYIQNNILSENEKDFNLTVLFGKDVDIKTVIESAKRYPMMSEYQVIVVKEAQMIKNWDDLKFYAEKPSKTTILCFCYKYGKPDGRKKWFQELSKYGEVFESKTLYENQIGSWIGEYISEKKLKISEQAKLMLVEFLGTDLTKIANEIDKLLLIKPIEDKELTVDLIEKNIGISRHFNGTELKNALVKRDVLKANRIINYFGENNSKDSPIQGVLGLLFNFFSNLMIYHYLGNKAPTAVATELKINPFFVREYEEAAKNYTAMKTMKIVSYIREADAKTKGLYGNGTPKLDIMKELIFKILH